MGECVENSGLRCLVRKSVCHVKLGFTFSC